MTCGPYAIIAERAIFLLSEMEDAAERLIFFWGGGETNTPNAAFESSYFHTAFREAPTGLSGSRHRKMGTLMRGITSVWWLSRFLTDAHKAAFKVQINTPTT